MMEIQSKSRKLKQGDSVTHAVFGRGTIIELINDGSNSKARVDFDSSGQKTLLLKYSKLVKN